MCPKMLIQRMTTSAVNPLHIRLHPTASHFPSHPVRRQRQGNCPPRHRLLSAGQKALVDVQAHLMAPLLRCLPLPKAAWEEDRSLRWLRANTRPPRGTRPILVFTIDRLMPTLLLVPSTCLLMLIQMVYIALPALFTTPTRNRTWMTILIEASPAFLTPFPTVDALELHPCWPPRE